MVQSVKFSSENLFLVQNNLIGSNTIWTRSKIVFGLMEGQSISEIKISSQKLSQKNELKVVRLMTKNNMVS